jgi:hypothetical protein
VQNLEVKLLPTFAFVVPTVAWSETVRKCSGRVVDDAEMLEAILDNPYDLEARCSGGLVICDQEAQNFSAPR